MFQEVQLYRILGDVLAGDHNNYRGACREQPEFVEAVSENARINTLLAWFANELHDRGYVVDLQNALELVAEYKQFNVHIEVVRLSFEEDIPRQYEEFLGVDVVDKTLYSLGSLISSGINFTYDASVINGFQTS